MGSDLIGYWAFIPVKTHKALLKAHCDMVDALLKIEPKTTKEATALLKELAKVGVPVGEFGEQDLGDLDIVRDVAEFLKDARAFDLGGFFRDMSSSEITVNKTDVCVLFAGDRSWGDEPEGAGYEMLKSLHNIGMIDVWHSAIPWNGKVKKVRAQSKAFVTLKLKV